MKIKINRNIFWTETFVRELASVGVKYACISPGSRNTPLTLAFAANKAIKTFIHIDERSSGFFALGLAMASDSPVALVCTSGTATAELYPAIIEAYQQRVPLIVCTADRPPELLDTGANQTINQNNLYKNHIRKFFDAGLPEPIVRRIKFIKELARRSVHESCINSRGPVHINFPFRKPFEPESYTDQVSKSLIELSEKISGSKKSIIGEKEQDIVSEKWFGRIFNHLKTGQHGLIIAGPENYNPAFLNKCQQLSEMLGYPILADGTSQLRFGRHSKKFILSHFDGFLRSKTFTKNHQPGIILHFGRTITSKALDTFLENCDSLRFMINEYGDWFDPSNKATASIACKPFLFCEKMVEALQNENFERKTNGWMESFREAESAAEKVKGKVVDEAAFPDEGRIINEIVKHAPNDCRIMLSNSMPVRDFDYFASITDKRIVTFNNRGASGIDGIISTALGIAAENKKPAVLITGDMAFYYDLNGLLASKKYNIPLTVVLVNNNGGGIFGILPISKYGKVFKDYFIASHNLDFEPFVKGYGGIFKKIKSWKNFGTAFKSAVKSKKLTVLEIKTNAPKSLAVRRKYWKEIENKLSAD